MKKTSRNVSKLSNYDSKMNNNDSRRSSFTSDFLFAHKKDMVYDYDKDSMIK